MFFNLFFILHLVLPKSNPASKNSNPSQENQTQHPRTQTHHKKTKEKKKQIIISHLNSMTHKTNPSKTQQDPNRITDLKKSVAASVVEVDSLGSAEEKEVDLTHHTPPIWPKVTEIELHCGRDSGWGRSDPPRTTHRRPHLSLSLSLSLSLFLIKV